MEHRGVGLSKLRFTGHTEPWEQKKLGDALKMVSGHPFKEEEYIPDGKYSVITNANIQGSAQLDLSSASKIDDLPEKLKEHQILKENDILITLDGSVGRASMVPKGNYVLAQRVGLLQLDKTQLNDLFTYSTVSHPRFIRQMQKQMQGGVIKHIYARDIENYVAPIPSIPEQEKIGGFLSALDERLRVQSELVDLLALEYTGYSQRIFAQTLRFKDENGNQYPDWEQKKLGEVTSIDGGYSFQSKDYVPSGARVIRISDVQSGFISDKDAKFVSEQKNDSNIDRYELFPNEIVMSLTGIVGRVARIQESHTPCYLNQRVARVKTTPMVDDKFIYSILNNKSFEKIALENSTGGAQKNMKTSWLNSYSIPLPSFPEQVKIGGFLSSLSARIEAERALLAQYKEQKKAYLQKLLP